MDKKPNIIYILADDLGYGDLSCYGAEKINTPNIDKIAKQGLKFTDAHSSSAVCTPSRYSIMTGRYCWRTRLKSGVLWGHGKQLIESDRLTVANMLKQKGYNTGVFGKWHLGLNWAVKDEKEEAESPYRYDYSKPFSGGPLDLGFDTFFGIAGSLDMPPYTFLSNDRVYKPPVRLKDKYYPQQREGLQCDGWDDKTVDLKITEKAVEFIKENSDRPFLAYIPFAAPHRPCEPPEILEGKSEAGKRGDMVSVVDYCVGIIEKTLEELNIKEETLIIFTSDNGARPCDVDGKMYGHKSTGDFRGYKADIWDGGHREPFVARWPEVIDENGVCDKTVGIFDFLSTCADIVDYNLKDGDAPDSISMLPYFKNPDSTQQREYIIHHSLKGMFSIRKGNWKFIDGIGSGGFYSQLDNATKPYNQSVQLYDLKDDPWEVSNRYKHKKQKAEELKAVLEKAKKGKGDRCNETG